MLPSVDNLRCFVEAARLRNFRAAARKVALTPAALGQRIKQLEHQLDARLFHRTTRTVVLTESGLALLPYAQRALAAAEDCTRAAHGGLSLTPVEITLGTRHELGISWVVPTLPLIKKTQPNLTTHLYFGSGADLLLRVRTLEIDCAVGSMVITDPKLDSFRLHREDYVLVAAPSLLKRIPLKRMEDAERHTLIDTHAELPLFSYWRGAPKGNTLPFGRTLFMGTIAAIRDLVLLGEGVAVLPKYLVDPDLQANRVRRVFPGVPLLFDHFRLVFRADDPRRALYERLAQVLLQSPLR
jgi:DNA-binding transcriptional LysR family regulator